MSSHNVDSLTKYSVNGIQSYPRFRKKQTQRLYQEVDVENTKKHRKKWNENQKYDRLLLVLLFPNK